LTQARLRFAESCGERPKLTAAEHNDVDGLRVDLVGLRNRELVASPAALARARAAAVGQLMYLVNSIVCPSGSRK
jgi:hypothetical protein